MLAFNLPPTVFMQNGMLLVKAAHIHAQQLSRYPFKRLIHSSLSSPTWKAKSLFTLPSGNQCRKTYATR